MPEHIVLYLFAALFILTVCWGAYGWKLALDLRDELAVLTFRLKDAKENQRS